MITLEKDFYLNIWITKEEYKRFKEKQEKECNYRHYCKLKHIPQCCWIFKMKLIEIISRGQIHL